MDYVLDRVGQRLPRADLASVMQEALLFALQRNKPLALQTLFEHNAEVSRFDVGRKFCYVDWARAQITDQGKAHQTDYTVQKAVKPGARKAHQTDYSVKKKYFQAAEQYHELLRHFSQTIPHNMLIRKDFRRKCKQVPTSWSAWLRGLVGPTHAPDATSPASRLEALDREFNKYNARCLSAGHPIPASLRKSIMQYATAEAAHVEKKILELTGFDKRGLKKELSKTPPGGTRLGAGILSVSNKRQKDGKDGQDQRRELNEMERKMRELTYLREIMLLEGIYVRLLGPAFRYRVGIQGTTTDLFFINVLGNREKLALEMWKQVTLPHPRPICNRSLNPDPLNSRHTEAGDAPTLAPTPETGSPKP